MVTQLPPYSSIGTAVSCAKTAELIEMPFGAETPVGLTNCVLDGAYIGEYN